MELKDLHIGWAKYAYMTPRTLVLCNSNDEGAFRIYDEAAIEQAYADGRGHQAVLELRARDKFIEDLKKKRS